jgi:4-hydroxybenzoate polyprenyltransferase
VAIDHTADGPAQPLEPITEPPSGATAIPAGHVAVARSVLACMRPRQWIKNSVVLAGVIFAGNVLDAASLAAAAAVTIAFCLASGAAYLLNDVLDAEVDRHDPRTAGRPIASGALSPRPALTCGAVAAGASLLIAGLVNDGSVEIVAAYLLLQIAYCYGLKHLVVIDLVSIALGFVLRAAAGGVAVDVRVSPWLLVATSSLALFLGSAKRRGELARPRREGIPRRPVLARYTPALMDRAIVATTIATLTIYVAYAARGAPSRWMLITVPFVVHGMLRVVATIRRDPAQTDDPTLLVLRDRRVLVTVALWAACATAVTVSTG